MQDDKGNEGVEVHEHSGTVKKVRVTSVEKFR